MIRTTTARERRLWMATVALVVAIFASLGQTPALAAALRARGLLEPAFGAGFLVVIGVVVASGLRRGTGYREWWVLVGVVVAYAMLVVRLGIGPEERTHLFEFGLVAILVRAALLERRGDLRWTLPPALIAFLIASGLGAADEFVQGFVPGRVFDPIDIVFNVVAAGMAIVASSAVSAARRRDSVETD